MSEVNFEYGPQSEFEFKKGLFEKYRGQIQKIIEANLDRTPSGEVDGIRYQVTFRSGKQQPVHILLFEFPGGYACEAVCRPTRRDFEEYRNHDSVRKYFPQFYISFRYPSLHPEEEADKCILLLEKIDGYDSKNGSQEFQELISDPDRFQQLSDEIFEAAHTTFLDGFSLDDIDPVSGHNVIFNRKEGRFHFLDIDTIHASDDPLEKKFFEWFHTSVHGSSEKSASFLIQMVKKIFEIYPKIQFRFESGEVVQREFKFLEEDEKFDGRIIPVDVDSTEYWRAARNVEWGLETARENPRPIKVVDTKGKNVREFDPDILSACLEGDTEKVKHLLSKNLNNNAVEKITFVPDSL